MSEQPKQHPKNPWAWPTQSGGFHAGGHPGKHWHEGWKVGEEEGYEEGYQQGLAAAKEKPDGDRE